MPALRDTAERRPAQCLRPYISHYAGFRMEGVAPGVTRGLPSRHVTLMIGLGAPFSIAHAGSFTSFVSGLHDTPALVERGRAINGLHLAASWPRRFDILDDVFARALEECQASREIAWAWRMLTAEAGGTRIEDVANAIGWTRRHFAERFGADLGIAPKTLARIIRFEHACALIKVRRGPLAEVPSASGYYDRSHLTREWQTLAGCTPRAWIAEELPFVQDYELAGAHDQP